MDKIELNFSKKAIAQAVLPGILFAVLLVAAVSQRVGIGQRYQEVTVNGDMIGRVAGHIDVQQAVLDARRSVAAESEERLCAEITCETADSRKPFQKLLSEEELKNALCEIITKSAEQESVRAYTVAIDGYHANFASLSDEIGRASCREGV